MATNTEYEELVKGLSKEELTAFKYVCDVMDFASTVNKKSYVLEVLNTTCSSLDTLTTGSRIVFDKDSKTIAVQTAGEIVKTITYETEMVGVKIAAAHIVRTGFSTGNPWGAGFGVVGGGGTYFIGSYTAEKFAEQAGVEAKEFVSEFLDKYIKNEGKIDDRKEPSSYTNITKESDTNTITKQTISLDDNQSQNSEQEALENKAIASFANKQDIEKIKIDNETYTIKKGDTLLEIARKNNTTIDKLIENNPWLNEENRISEDKSYALIKSGEKLNLTVEEIKNIQNQEKTLNEKINSFKNFTKVFMQETEAKEDIEKVQEKIKNIEEKENFYEKIKSLQEINFKEYTSNTYIEQQFSEYRNKIIEDSTTCQETTYKKTLEEDKYFSFSSVNSNQNNNSQIQTMN